MIGKTSELCLYFLLYFRTYFLNTQHIVELVSLYFYGGNNHTLINLNCLYPIYILKLNEEIYSFTMTESFPEALSDTCMSFKLSSNADTGILMLQTMSWLVRLLRYILHISFHTRPTAPRLVSLVVSGQSCLKIPSKKDVIFPGQSTRL